jgi:heat shock protein HslJ
VRVLGTFMLLAVVVLSACSSAGGSPAASAGASAGASAAASAGGAATLDGTTWNLTTIGGTAIAAPAVPTLEFGTGGMVSGLAGCNRFTGTATIGEGTIAFGPLATTRMACTDEATNQLETQYLAALEAAGTWTMEGDSLTIGDGTELVYAKG